jgi:hypothetical protein
VRRREAAQGAAAIASRARVTTRLVWPRRQVIQVGSVGEDTAVRPASAAYGARTLG